MNQDDQQNILLDLNNPVFQRQLFSLSKQDQRSVLNTLRKLTRMSWHQVYTDKGIKWETILSKTVVSRFFAKAPRAVRAISYQAGAKPGMF
jgi:hypothetical protein